MAKDADKEYLGGCLFVAAASIATILPPIVLCLLDQLQPPFRVISVEGLRFLFVWSLLPSGIAGLVLARLGGIAGAFGAFGGFLCGAAYWFMHLQQMIASAPVKLGSQTEYPDSTMWLVPIFWTIIGFFISFVPLYRNPRLQSKES